jgi:hypothetical protein
MVTEVLPGPSHVNEVQHLNFSGPGLNFCHEKVEVERAPFIYMGDPR